MREFAVGAIATSFVGEEERARFWAVTRSRCQFVSLFDHGVALVVNF